MFYSRRIKTIEKQYNALINLFINQQKHKESKQKKIERQRKDREIKIEREIQKNRMRDKSRKTKLTNF